MKKLVFIGKELCEFLGIEYPIIQGGMAWIATAPLVAAVSQAGGLGTIGAGSMSAQELKKEIKKIKRATGKPFSVNVALIRSNAAEQVKVVIEERVPVVTTSAGNPEKFTDELKKAGIKVLHMVSSVETAKRAEKAGVEAVIAEGVEAGGHNGIDEITTFQLVPQVVDAVEIPVIAAGGITDGQIGVHPKYTDIIGQSADWSTRLRFASRVSHLSKPEP